MAYTRGSSNDIIVGAAALFTYENGSLTDADLPGYVAGESYKDTLTEETPEFRNVGYTMNGLEIQFQPDFGEVAVDQVLDVAKLFKQGMQVNLNTTFAESTLENLLFALAGKGGIGGDLGSITGTGIGAGSASLNLSAGDIGDVPVERGLVAVGPGTGDASANVERVYVAYRALSIESVSVSAKRDEATMFEVSFRLLPNDNASYGKIVDRTIPAGA
jgi:hypothetical protein